MPALDNPRHEYFAQYLAQGKTQDEAYKLAGYRPSRFNASHLADKPSIRDRVHQLTTEKVAATAARDAARAAVTAESLLYEFEQAREQAMKNGREGNANNAIKGKAVLSGHWVERKEIGAPGEFEALQDDELERMLVQHLGELGFSLSPIAEDGETEH
jgi:phage terminase small subunit